MTEIAVNRFHARYRLGAGMHGQRDRLQRIVANVLDSGLEAAVQRSGIDTSGELCIREVKALARLNTADCDSALATRVALAIADAIEADVGKADADVVRYGSRAHALVDLAIAAIGGDFTRSWAWRRLGLWNAESMVSAPSAVRLVLAALTADPRHATAAIVHLAHKPMLFDRLLQYAAAPQLVGLARTLVEIRGAPVSAPRSPTDAPPTLPRGVDSGRARDLVRRSIIATAAARSRRGHWITDERCDALAVLSISEVEPALLCGADAQTWIRAVASDLLEAAARAVAVDRPAEYRQRADEHPGAGLDRTSGIADETATAARAGEMDAASAERCPPASNVPAARGDRQRRASAMEPASQPAPDIRRRAHTRFGGLLFLVHLLGRQSLQRLLHDPKLAARGPRWCLHQLAMALAPLSALDPAALAFAGLLPQTEPPCAGQPAPSEAETGAVAELRDALLGALRAVLERPEQADSTLADFVCRRTAEIVADPGWLEVRFALDDVDTGIRAAGLDLDPGWVPWLGLVVKFVYA